MKMSSILFLIFVAPQVSGAGSFIIEEMRDESATSSRPFLISYIEPFSGGLRLFLATDDIANVARLLNTGKLAAQLSEGENETTVPLALGKAVHCDGETFHLNYAAPLPDCDIERTDYFLSAPVTLRSGSDLAIGLDHDFFWLVEERQ